MGLNALRVNVGCGLRRLPGYVNVDAQGEPAARPDLIHDVRVGLPLEAGSVHEVRADQFLEHLTLAELVAFLAESRRVLVVGGELRCEVPDIAGIARLCAEGRQDHVLGSAGIEPLPGVPPGLQVLNCSARDAWGHRTCLTAELTRQLFERAGFRVLYAATCGTNAVVIGCSESGPP